MAIRAANEEDIPGIVSCNLSAKTEEELKGFAPPRGFSPFHSVKKLRDAWVSPNIVDGGMLFVCDSGRIEGYVSIIENDDFVEIDNIDVAKEFQGFGLGRRLVEFVEEYSCKREFQRIVLGTTKNKDGIPWKGYQFWLKMGYVPFEEIETAVGRKYRFKEIRLEKRLNCNSERGGF